MKSKVEELLDLMVKENQVKVEKAMTEALLYGSATITVEGGGTVTWSSPQNPNYWGDSVISLTKREWEQEVQFD